MSFGLFTFWKDSLPAALNNEKYHYYKNTIHRFGRILRRSKWLYSCMLDSPDQYLNKAIRRICLPSYWKKIYIIWLRLSHLTFWWEKCKQMICWNFYLIKITFNIHCSLFTRIKKCYFSLLITNFFCSNELHEDLKKGLAEVSSLFITELQKNNISRRSTSQWFWKYIYNRNVI